MIHSRPIRTVLTRAFLAAALFLTGCDHPQRLDSAAGSPDTAERILVRGNGPEPDSLDPQRARTTGAQTILRDLFECLTSLDHDAGPAPGAAESWAVSSDGKTYTFRLRPGGRWSNGDPVTGADFVAGLRRLADPATASENGALIDIVRNARQILRGSLAPDQLGVTAPNDSTVVVELEQPAGYLLGILAHPSTCPIHRSMLARRGASFTHAGEMVSNGAFVLNEWLPGTYIVARRNRFYWNDKKTFWDVVKYMQIADENAEFLRYRAGDIQITATIPRNQILDFKTRRPGELHSAPELGTYYYGFNLNREPFRDSLKLRQALLLAIDRKQLAASVLGAGETAAYSWVPQGVHAYTPPSPDYATYTTDQRVQLARRLYKEAGFSSVRPLRFELSYNSGEVHTRLAIVIAQMWKDTLGAEVRLVTEDFRALLNDIDTGRVEVFRSSWIADYNDAQAFLQVLRSDSGVNLTHYRSAKFDEFLDRASAELNVDERRSLFYDAERTMLEDAPLIPLYFYESKHLVSPQISGWYSNIMNVVYSKDLSIGSAAVRDTHN